MPSSSPRAKPIATAMNRGPVGAWWWRAALVVAGYAPGWPSGDARAVDRATAAAMRCRVCDRPELACEGWVREGPNGRAHYRALAVCPRCQAAEEL